MNVPSIYCPRCSDRLTEREVQGKLRPVCPTCGLVIYRNPRLVASVIPVLEGKVVLVRRAMNPRRGTWVFPGGYVDAGETVEDAARRETREETGLEVELERLLGIYSRQGEEVVLVVYVGRVTGGTLTVGEEELDVRLFEPCALPPEDELGFWSTCKALDEWKRTPAQGVATGAPVMGSHTG